MPDYTVGSDYPYPNIPSDDGPEDTGTLTQIVAGEANHARPEFQEDSYWITIGDGSMRVFNQAQMDAVQP